MGKVQIVAQGAMLFAETAHTAVANPAQQLRSYAEGIGVRVEGRSNAEILNTLHALARSIIGVSKIVADLEDRLGDMPDEPAADTEAEDSKSDEPLPDLDSEPSAPSSPSAPPRRAVPLFTLKFGFSIKPLRWGREYESGRTDTTKSPMLMEQYGFALLGAGRRILLGAPQPDDIAFAFVDALTRISVVGRLPKASNADKVRTELVEDISQMVLKGNGLSTKPSSLKKLLLRLEDNISPHEYEFARMALELTRLDIPIERLTGGAILFIKNDATKGAVPLPHEASFMGAAKLTGLCMAEIKNVPLDFGNTSPLIYEADEASLSLGDSDLLRVSAPELNATENAALAICPPLPLAI